MPLDDEMDDLEDDGSDDLDTPIFTRAELELWGLQNNVVIDDSFIQPLSTFGGPEELRGQVFPFLIDALNYLLDTTMISHSVILKDEDTGMFMVAIGDTQKGS